MPAGSRKDFGKGLRQRTSAKDFGKDWGNFNNPLNSRFPGCCCFSGGKEKPRRIFGQGLFPGGFRAGFVFGFPVVWVFWGVSENTNPPPGFPGGGGLGVVVFRGGFV